MAVKKKRKSVVLTSGNQISAIKRAIENYIHPKNHRSDFYVEYSNWYCGVTNDSTKRKAKHKWGKKIPALYFHAWNAKTKANSLEVEKHFHNKGMRGISKSPGGVRSTSVQVYVFKWKTNIADDLAHFFEMVE